MKRVRIGLIGAGVMGGIHAQNLAQRIPRAELAAIADLKGDRAQALAEATGGVAYDNDAELLAHPGLDAVVICTPGHTHGQLIAAAAAAGKHIFCEKPLDTDLARVDAALAAVRRVGIKLQLGFHRRFDAGFRRVMEAVDSGSVGRVLSVQMTSRDPVRVPAGPPKVPGDLFLDTSIHDMDMARHLLGEIESVYTLGGTMAGPEVEARDDPDTAVMTLRSAGGVLVTIFNSRLSADGYDQRLEVLGTGGRLTVDNEPGRSAGAQKLPVFAQRYADAYVAEMAAFADCLLLDRGPPVTAEDGRAAVVLALAADRSYREGRPVLLTEFG